MKKYYRYKQTAILCLSILCLGSSALAEQTLIQFSAMGDTPYGVSDMRKLQHQLKNLNPSSTFVIHLGDIKTGITPCSNSWYQQVADILRTSPKPLFIIPGDNEWNDCFDPEDAWTLWTRHFLHFDKQWPDTLHVVRDNRHLENFAFVSNGVLFVGLNLVGGKVLDPIQWSIQDRDNIQWIESQVRDHKQSISRLVILGHALPNRYHRTFFVMLSRLGQSFGKPMLYLHGDGHKWIQDYPFTAKNILRVEVDNGGGANPVTVKVTDDPDEPFVFVR